MKCILLCAGYSTDDNLKIMETASALHLIKGKPLVNYTVEALDNIDIINEIYLVTNGLYYGEFIDWYNQYSFSTKITIINDNTTSIDAKLGAIGDIRYTINCENIDEDIIVLAGDAYYNFSLKSFVNHYMNKQESTVAGMYTEDRDLLSRSGVIDEKDGFVVRMQEKPANPKGNILSLAAYIYTSDVLRDIDDYLSEGNKTTYPGYFLEYICRMKPVHLYKIAGSYYDLKGRQAIENIEETVSKLFDK